MPTDALTVSLHRLKLALRALDLGGRPVLAHASLSAFGQVEGGAPTVAQALVEALGRVMMPTHTYKTMVTPRDGPPDNGITYGAMQDLNRMAEFWSPDMPADRLMGAIPEALRLYPGAKRSMHPILSFAGVGVDDALAAQTLDEPLAPIGVLSKQNGWVLLMGVNHTVNTAIHYAEKLAKRRQFIRWALTEQGIVACPGFPCCSAGFQAIEPDVAAATRTARVGNAILRAVPMADLFYAVIERLRHNPRDLLCSDPDCERCNQIRKTPRR
ncbi:MAG: AAC(3) family N-acetyltransferase [Anaerolineales bacterium]